MEINLLDKIQKNQEILHSEIDGEVVLLSLESGKYYKIDEIGSIIWAKIENPISIAALCEELLEEFEVGEAKCKEDVLNFISKLAEDKLISIE